MPLVIEQRFPLGRFHATRWNQNPFEDPYGEWPPSPWRLLRALAARWFQYARETGDSDTTIRDGLLQALARSLPAFYLPPLTWRGPVLKYYQPTEVAWTDASKKSAAYKASQRTLVEDHYRTLPPNESVFWHWEDLALTEEQLNLLDRLLDRIVYFGRAESFCRLRRINAVPNGVQLNATLLKQSTGNMPPVLAALPQEELDMDILLASTDGKELRGRPIPPGTEWYYAAIPPQPTLAYRRSHAPHLPANLNCLQFAVGGRVYPPMPQWIKITERFRGRVLSMLSAQLIGHTRSHYGLLSREQREQLALISGKDGTGQPLRGHHHAFFILWPDDNGLPTRLLVWRHQPFTPSEIQALLTASERPVSWDRGTPDWPIHLIPLPFETPLPHGLTATACKWRSALPFVPPTGRHRFRKNGRMRPGESPERILTKLLRSQGLPPPNNVTFLGEQNETTWTNVHETRQRRQNGTRDRQPPVRPGDWMEIEFAEPVRGPLIFGESCHFGLGLFVPVKP